MTALLCIDSEMVNRELVRMLTFIELYKLFASYTASFMRRHSTGSCKSSSSFGLMDSSSSYSQWTENWLHRNNSTSRQQEGITDFAVDQVYKFLRSTQIGCQSIDSLKPCCKVSLFHWWEVECPGVLKSLPELAKDSLDQSQTTMQMTASDWAE